MLQIDEVPAEKMQALIEGANASGITPQQYALQLILGGLESRERVLPSFQEVEDRKEKFVPRRTVTEWYGRLEDAEHFPDLAYWQSQDDETKFAAAWEMVIEAHQIRGEDIRESKLDKSVGGLQRREG
jgi:hypothetical protein